MKPGETDILEAKTQHAMQPMLIRTAEAAQLLAISERTLWRWASTGVVAEPFRANGVTRWRYSDIVQVVLKSQKPLTQQRDVKSRQEVKKR